MPFCLRIHLCTGLKALKGQRLFNKIFIAKTSMEPSLKYPYFYAQILRGSDFMTFRRNKVWRTPHFHELFYGYTTIEAYFLALYKNTKRTRDHLRYAFWLKKIRSQPGPVFAVSFSLQIDSRSNLSNPRDIFFHNDYRNGILLGWSKYRF